MKRQSPSIKIYVIVAVVLISTFLAIWKFANFQSALGFSFVQLLFIIVFTIATKLFEALSEKFINRLANTLEHWGLLILSGYKNRYLEHLRYRYRGFDTRGLTTQGDFNLELEKVYVELYLQSTQTKKIVEGPTCDQTIWDYLNLESVNGAKLVIVGKPGSGKTTLLRQVTLILASNAKHHTISKTNRLPVLITLREIADQVRKKPEILLPEIIQETLARMDRRAPSGWFENYLRSGRCVVMMDGLDEIADVKSRYEIVEWVQNQMDAYPHNHFILTSRQHGYESNLLRDVKELMIKNFSRDQVETFIHNWYIANEVMRSQKDDPGVRMIAHERAKDLIERLSIRPALANLAENPLLVTMIATVHSFKIVLPGRRVELYRDIFDVFIERRRRVIWLDDYLSKDQKLKVLQTLAYQMMSENLRAISKSAAYEIIRDDLSMTGAKISEKEFLQRIEEQSGLIIEVEHDQLAFAHLTFQEYLASVHVKENKLESILLLYVGDSWWEETIRLYAAQTDATTIIEACIGNENIEAPALGLAIDCLTEAFQIQSSIRAKVEDTLNKSMDDPDPKHRAPVSEALLSTRLRWMLRIDDNLSVDNSLVSNIEYQLFIDEMSSRGRYYHPDHWIHERFPLGQGRAPIVGVRSQDVSDFCEWLTGRDIWIARYTIPFGSIIGREIPTSVPLAYWTKDEENKTVLFTQQVDTVEQNINLSIAYITETRVHEYLSNDIDMLYRLNEADREDRRPKPSAAELLGRSIGIPRASSYGDRRLGVPERELELQSLRRFENRNLLDNFMKYSKLLNIDLMKFLQAFSNLDERENYFAWLPNQNNNLYLLDRIDILNLCQQINTLLNTEVMHASLNQTNRSITDDLIKAVNLLESRQWRAVDIEDHKGVYSFLRWYIRICTTYLYLNFTSRIHNRNSAIFVDDLKQIFANTIVTLLVIEERIQGNQSTSEAIRLCKVMRS